MRHYGLQTKDGEWLCDDSGMIFWTTCRAVAESQGAIYNKYLNDGESEVHVMEFISDEEANQMQKMFNVGSGTLTNIGSGDATTGAPPLNTRITIT